MALKAGYEGLKDFIANKLNTDDVYSKKEIGELQIFRGVLTTLNGNGSEYYQFPGYSTGYAIEGASLWVVGDSSEHALVTLAGNSNNITGFNIRNLDSQSHTWTVNGTIRYVKSS